MPPFLQPPPPRATCHTPPSLEPPIPADTAASPRLRWIPVALPHHNALLRSCLRSSESGSAAKEEEEPPADFICPITTELMSDPVMAADGHSYERSAIERWLATKSTSPMTGEALVQSFLAPNHTLRRQIREWEEANACCC